MVRPAVRPPQAGGPVARMTRGPAVLTGATAVPPASAAPGLALSATRRPLVGTWVPSRHARCSEVPFWEGDAPLAWATAGVINLAPPPPRAFGGGFCQIAILSLGKSCCPILDIHVDGRGCFLALLSNVDPKNKPAGLFPVLLQSPQFTVMPRIAMVTAWTLEVLPSLAFS